MMPNNPNATDNLKSWKPGQSGNPAGKPKGTKHLSTWIQNLLNDEEFEANILDSKVGVIEYKGAPIKAIVMVALRKAAAGDEKAREWLAKYGYGQKFEVDQNISGQLDTGIQDPQLAKDFAEYLKNKHD
jgi:hypothetical protein